MRLGTTIAICLRVLNREVSLVRRVAVLLTALASAACQAIGPPDTPPEHAQVAVGKRPRMLRLALPTNGSSELGRSSALCAASCDELARVEESYLRCLAACPGATATWDAQCPHRGPRAVCVEHFTAVPIDPESARRESAVAEFVLNTVAVLAIVSAHVAIFELCESSSDPHCHEDWDRFGRPVSGQ